MTEKENKYFRTIDFTSGQIKKYYDNACHTLKIAGDDNNHEVRFDYSYKALIKSGITLIAAMKNAKVRGIPGHHIKIIEVLSEILSDDTIVSVGNAMRAKRNLDLYCGETTITK
ncbi:MAG: hypothetical protein Q7J59_03525, partial [Elusimicrobiota bacterium]|nr:hypothetical protein [Elusimicrobiota bacterium]